MSDNEKSNTSHFAQLEKLCTARDKFAERPQVSNLTLLESTCSFNGTNSVLCAILHHHLISVTQCLPSWVEKIVERGIPSKTPNVDLEIQSYILASIVERSDGSANLVEPNC